MIRRLDGIDKVNPKRQHIAVVNGVHNGVSMQFIAEGLGGCPEQRVADQSRVGGKYRRAG